MTPLATPPSAARNRIAWIFAVWTVVLILGYLVVVALGSPLPTASEELAAAKTPPTPVSEDVARRSADTIVRLEYPDFVGLEPAVERRTDFGVDRFLVVYSDQDQAAGLRISITVDRGLVEVASYN
jgi:hypothetical protein